VPAVGAPVECVVNVSEGRDRPLIAHLAAAGGESLLDLHSDAEHHRSVLTLGGPLDEVEAAARAVAEAAVRSIDLTDHVGVHPRLGVVDVVPFVPLVGGSEGVSWWAARGARDRFAAWAGSVLGVPCFRYGPERTLPDVRRLAFTTLDPDTGPHSPHPTAGACAVGVRLPLVAYNVWIAGSTGHDGPDAVVAAARAIATSLRSPSVRSLGLAVATGAQVSCNLVDATAPPPDALYDAVAAQARSRGCTVTRAELVGLVPEAMLRPVPRRRWSELDLGEDRTIESRLARRGVLTDGG
jgi:glutamate formiminotransferase